jgi:holo-[acyl-carrier protein] synthase
MIYGIGIDLIEVKRVARLVEGGIRFKERIYTARERAYCDQKRHGAQNYAARFAAKEAFFKALGTGWRGGLTFQDVEILNDEYGKPEIVLHNKAREAAERLRISRIHVSLTHIKEMASSVVTLEIDKEE